MSGVTMGVPAEDAAVMWGGIQRGLILVNVSLSILRN